MRYDNQKLGSPAQRELRESIQEYAASTEVKTAVNELYAEACAAHIRELARFIADPKDGWVKKYKASLSNNAESKGKPVNVTISETI